jgi:hypothetical protein
MSVTADPIVPIPSFEELSISSGWAIFEVVEEMPRIVREWVELARPRAQPGLPERVD